MGWPEPADSEKLYADVAQRLKALKTTTPRDQLVAQRLAEIYRKHPYIQTGTALSLAEALADDQTVDAVAQQSAQTQYATNNKEAQVPPKPSFLAKTFGKWFGNLNPAVYASSMQDNFIAQDLMRGFGKIAHGILGGVFGSTLGKFEPLKEASKAVEAVGKFPGQYYTNYLSRITDPTRPLSDTEGIIASTSLGAYLQHHDETGTGFFVGGDAEKKRVEKVRQYRWKLANGDSFTIGRGTASLLFQPGSNEYRYISGVIDAGVSYKTDVFNVIPDELSKINALKKVIPAIETADEARAAAVLAETGGLYKSSVQHTIDTSKFFDWLDNSKPGRYIVQRAAEETNPLKMLEGFDYTITPDEARRLAQATDVDQVRGIIAEQAIRLKDTTTQGFVPFASTSDQIPMSKMLYDRIPGYRTLKNSKLFAGVPSEVLAVRGTPEQKTLGVKNISNWLKGIGEDPYTGRGAALMEKAFDWAGSLGGSTDIYRVRQMMFGTNKEPGIFRIALERNGQSEEVIQGALAKIEDNFARLHANAIDDTGHINDLGTFKYLTSYQTEDELRSTLQGLNEAGFISQKVTSKTTWEEMQAIVNSLEDGQVSIISPLSLSQMAKNVIILPNFRQMKRLTNPFFSGSNLDVAAQIANAVDLIQNQVWRPLALMTVGFIMRNSVDAQLRMAMAGISTNRPLDFLAMAMTTPKNIERWGLRARGWETITGEGWVDFGGDMMDVPAMMEDYVRASTLHSRWIVDDTAHELVQKVKDGQVALVNTSQGEQYVQGFVDTARRHNNDVFMRFAAQLQDVPIARQKKAFAEFLDSGTPDALRARREIVGQMQDGMRVTDQATGLVRTLQQISNADKLSTTELVNIWYENNAVRQIEHFVKNQSDLRVLVGYGDTPTGALERWDEATATELNPMIGVKPKRGDLLVNDVTVDVAEPKFDYYRVLETSEKKVGGKTVTSYGVVPVKNPGAALKPEQGTFEVQDFIRNKMRQNAQYIQDGLDSVIPGYVATSVRTPIQGTANQAADVFNSLKGLSDRFFRGPVSNWSRITERSPTVRTMYYRLVADNAGGLTRSEATKLLEDIHMRTQMAIPERYAKNAEKAVSDYLGGKDNYKLFKENIDRAIATDKGIGTIDQLETFAQTRARVDAERLFFSNLEKNNLQDALRIAMPFGSAWYEVLGTYAKAMIENPARMQKTSMVYRGLQGYDPDQDGRGVFYKDATSGQLMFAFPFSSQIIRAMSTGPLQLISKIPGVPDLGSTTPLDAQFTAPVKQLNAGLSFIPSLGPVFQIATGKLFDWAEIPNEEGFRKLLNPYGTTGFDAMLPGAWKKIGQALFATDTTNGSTYANSFADVFAHLASTGEYDLADSNEVERLTKDAQAGARGITLLRGISQFIGPTAGRPEFRYTKKDKENPALDQVFYVGEMAKVLSKLQADNYETAVPKFIEMFGNNGYIYLGSKTKVNPAYGGLEVSKEFEAWRTKNRGLIAAHKSVASYLAPVGNRDFDQTAWVSQMGEGLRQRLDGYDRLALSQFRAGSGMYRAFRKTLPTILSDSDEQSLKDYRAQLHQALPFGFPLLPVFSTNEVKQQIEDFKKLIADKRTNGNPVRDALSNYLTYRDQQIAYVESRSGRTLAATKDPYAQEARGNLYAYGERLATAVPDFARVWQEVLVTETDMGTQG